MKVCTRCRELQGHHQFNKQKKSPDELSNWCKSCTNQYNRAKYQENLEKKRNKTNARRAARIQWLQQLKAHQKCVDCGQTYEPYCMDYDHLPNKGSKIKSVSRMVMDNVPKDKILEEINKCDLVCLLCHNKRTYIRFNETLGDHRKYRPHQQRNIDLINRFKNTTCTFCHQKYDICNMQIDHIDPATKLYDVCTLKSCKLEKLRSELDKCQVLCALCHRRKSILEQRDKKYHVRRAQPHQRRELFYDLVANSKECGLCYQIKDLLTFRINKKTSSGYDTYCKECFIEYKRKRRAFQKTQSVVIEK